MIRPKRTFIAEILLAHKLITQEQLNTAIEKQKNSDKKIGRILVDLGFVDEMKMLELVAEQLQIPFIDLKKYALEPSMVILLPEFYARHFRAIVLKRETNSLFVGMADPQDLIARDEIERILKSKITVGLIREDDLLQIFDNFYRHAEEISHYAETLSAEIKPEDVNVFQETQDFSTEDLPVVNLLRSIFEDAAQVNASDIHIEPGEDIIRVRLRIDGVLQEQIIPEKSISQALVQRVKLAAGLNIAEKRLPQDGRFTINVKKKKFDVRVSTMPVQYGESLVMRLLDQSSEILQLSQIGMPNDIYEYFKHVLTASYGLLLLVGPTGSGKTTTLYSALTILNKPDVKIITVEDPVEYQLPRINQVQVNTKIELTFANVLRAILRQDPDIIMIGELRDFETMEIALRAAMTGHFVLSTLHTNDTISTATRLIDMGAEGFLLGSVLRAIMAQRLVRRICDKCATNYEPTEAEREWLKSIDFVDLSKVIFKKGKGCSYCHQTGYRGRIGVYELLPITTDLILALRKSDINAFEEAAKKQPLYRPLLHTALDLAIKGITTIREVITMTGEI